MYLLFQSEDAERSRGVEVVCYVEWEPMKLRDRSQFGDTKILVGLCKDKKIEWWRHRCQALEECRRQWPVNDVTVATDKKYGRPKSSYYH
jgi:hypothetical protein